MIATGRSMMKRMLREKVPKAEIARRLGVCRQTVYNWEKQEDRPDPAKRSSKLDPYTSYIENRLESYDLPATVLFRELQEQGYTGKISILRDYVAPIKQGHVRRVVERFETEPGRQAQMDWANCGTLVHKGRRRRLSLLVVVLGYSRFTWAQFVVSERRPVLMELLERAFRELGGAPRELLVDNLKQVVAEVKTARMPARIQSAFAAFAEHWGFEVQACPPYWPRAKGKVERAIEYVQTSFLEGREFADLDDLNGQLRTWLAQVANVRCHATTKEQPADRLKADQAAMLPVLGRAAFPGMEMLMRRADHDARISYEGVLYSVDPHILGPKRGVPVEVRIGTDERLRAYHDGALVADHALAPKGSPPQDNPLHAVARRRLRQRPPQRRPRGRGPHFEQRLPDPPRWFSDAPRVATRALATYEEDPCSPN